ARAPAPLPRAARSRQAPPPAPRRRAFRLPFPARNDPPDQAKFSTSPQRSDSRRPDSRDNPAVEDAVATDAAVVAEAAEPVEETPVPVRKRPWPECVLALLVVVWSFEFIRLPMLRYDRYWTFGFDLGIYDQGTWLLSRGKDPFVTIRGLEIFGH